MASYKELYFQLFGALADAVEELEDGRILRATDRLIRALREAEEQVMEQDVLPDAGGPPAGGFFAAVGRFVSVLSLWGEISLQVRY